MWVTLLSQRPSFPSFHREEEKVGLVAPLSVCSMLVAAFVATTPAATFHGSTLGVVWGKWPIASLGSGPLWSSFFW